MQTSKGRKRKSSEEHTVEAAPVVIEATKSNDLHKCLEKLKQQEGVVGYILRNTTTAIVDLEDPTKIVDYAMLSSSASEIANKLSAMFELGGITGITIDGKDARMLCLTIGENKVDIFMEKTADSVSISRFCREQFSPLG